MSMKSIRNMSDTVWFQTMDQYPRTVDQMELLIYVVDTMGIFNNFDLSKTENMDAKRLDLIYAILRITNKEFELATNEIVKRIFIKRLKSILGETGLRIDQRREYTQHSLSAGSLWDQLAQDMDHFVCTILKKYYSRLKHPLIVSKFIDYLKKTFENRFYKKMIPGADSNFYLENEHIFSQITKDFIYLSKRKLDRNHRTMCFFLEKIFDMKTSMMVIAEINFNIQKNFDVRNLFEENCTEIDVYCEQKVDGELELITTDSTEEQLVVESIGYKVYYSDGPSILQPFIDHQFSSSKKDLIQVLIYNMSKYKSKWISNCAFLSVPSNCQRIPSADEICRLLKESENNLELIPPGLILKIMSWTFKIRIELYTKDLNLIEIDHLRGCDKHPLPWDNPDAERGIIIYQQNATDYYSLYSIGKKFIPVNAKIIYSGQPKNDRLKSLLINF